MMSGRNEGEREQRKEEERMKLGEMFLAQIYLLLMRRLRNTRKPNEQE